MSHQKHDYLPPCVFPCAIVRGMIVQLLEVIFVLITYNFISRCETVPVFPILCISILVAPEVLQHVGLCHLTAKVIYCTAYIRQCWRVSRWKNGKSNITQKQPSSVPQTLTFTIRARLTHAIILTPTYRQSLKLNEVVGCQLIFAKMNGWAYA